MVADWLSSALREDAVLAVVLRWLRLARLTFDAPEAQLYLEACGTLLDPGETIHAPDQWCLVELALPSGTVLGHIGLACGARGWGNREQALLSEIGAALVSDLDKLWRDSLMRDAVASRASRLERALDTMDQGVVLIDASGAVGVMNARAALMLDQPLDIRVVAGTSNATDQTVQEESGLVTEAHRRDGRVLEVRSLPLPDGGMVQTYADITARRRAEEAMASSEARYRLLAENASDMIALVDRTGTAAYVSPASRNLLQREPESLLGGGLASLFDPDDADTFDAALSSAFRGQPSASCEVRLRRKDGSSAWVEVQLRRAGPDAAPGGLAASGPKTRDSKPTPMDEPWLVAVVRDVSERRSRDEMLREAIRAARQASEAKGEFLAMMSHEIRSPLHAVIGFTELLERDAGLSTPQRQTVHRIAGAGQSLLAIVDDILDFSALDTGLVRLAPQDFSLSVLVDDSVALVRERALAKGLRVDVILAPDLPARLHGDDRRIGQVLLNLLNNAVKFTPSGHVALSVTRQDSAIRFSVSDTGIGIPNHLLCRLFQRFSQADGSISRRFGGSGLGLAIARQLVTLMHGTIGVQSREGEGTTFHVDLDLPLAHAEPSTSVPLPVAAPSRPARVLLVDDLEMNRVLAGAMLRDAGHEVREAASGREALALLDLGAFDCVLMDIQMPELDGVQTTRSIRDRGDDVARIPVIALTSAVMSEQVEALKAAGLDDHVGKPFRRDALLAAVERWTGAFSRGGWTHDTSKSEEVGAFEDEIAIELAGLIGEATLARMTVQFSERLEQLNQALSGPFRNEDLPPEVSSAVHQMVSASGMLGFRLLSASLSALENAARSGGETVAARELVLSQAAVALRRLRAAQSAAA